MPNTMAIESAIKLPHGFKKIRYSVTLSGNYVQAVRGANTGEVLALGSATNPLYLPDATWGQKGPLRACIVNGPAGNQAEIIPGADSLHWLLKFFSAADTELGAGAYSATIKADADFVVEFEAN